MTTIIDQLNNEGKIKITGQVPSIQIGPVATSYEALVEFQHPAKTILQHNGSGYDVAMPPHLSSQAGLELMDAIFVTLHH